jgi:demethylmenaquinone methyltransferase/2-methoxy-6-polyprenyl-1,4-benzoquinol methylase
MRYNSLKMPIPAEKADTRLMRHMFGVIAPKYDFITRVFSYGMDMRWKRQGVKMAVLPERPVVLDLACGTGDFCRELAAYDLVPIGADLSYGMLAAGRSGAPLVQADILRLPVPDASVDGVTCGFALRNLVELEAFFVELARVVRPGGRVAILEVAEPPNPVMRWGHGVYFGKVVPRIGGLLSDPTAYRYLPKSVAYLPPPDELLALFRGAGFTDGTRTLFSGGISQLLLGTRDRADWT